MKYNILLIMTDQMRWDALGCVGGWTRTPVLDQLTTEGVTFTNCMTNSPVCSPTRISLATGQYPHNTGVWRNLRGHDVPGDTPTFMKVIREAGYRTSIIGKAHLHHHEGDIRDREYIMHDLGFDDVNEIAGPRACSRVMSHMTEEWKNQGVLDAYVEDFRERFNNKPYVARPSTLPLELYYDVYVGRKAKEYIEHVADHQPWFCQVGFSGPHEPWDAPEPYASLYDPATMPRPIVREMFQDDDSRPRGNLDKLMTEKNDHSPPVTLDEIAQMRANYAGNVTLIDEQIGGIIQALKDRGEYDRTVIVFVSDHGEMNGDYGLIYKENFFNGAVKVPLIISTPEIRANRDLRGTVSDTMVELFDLGPTFCDIAGGTIAHQQFGQSLQRHLQDPLQVHRLDAMSQHKGEVMLATQNYKIVFNQQGEPYLFFDVSKDPQELCNRIGDPQYEEVIAHFQQRLGQRLISSQKYLQFDRPDTAGIEHLVGKK